MGTLRQEEEDASSAATKSGRFLRLENILGGKSRRAVKRPGEGGAFAGDSKLEGASKKSINCVDGVHADETILEASTNSHISNNVHPNDLGLEIAMKQLMEATHDALVNMKGEILRMQYDLERALVEISLLQQREELLQQSEQSMLGKLESLLEKMRVLQKNDGKGDALTGSSPDNKLAFERIQETQQRCHTSSNAPTPSECSSVVPIERGKARVCIVPIPTLVSSLKEEAKLLTTHHPAPAPAPAPAPPPPPPPPLNHRYSCTSKAAAGVLQELQQEHVRNIKMFKENAPAVASTPHQQKEASTRKMVSEKRPALRILKPKNFKISDLLVSDSDEEMGRE